MNLGKYLKDKLSSDPGLEVFGRFDKSILRPSKKLMDHTGDMINQQQIFHLIDEQKRLRKVVGDRRYHGPRSQRLHVHSAK